MEYTGQTPRILFMAPHGAGSQHSAHLALAGWQVVEAADEIEAFTAVRGRHIDLALLHMGVQDSADMDLPNVLRSVADDTFLPVMVLCGQEEQCACQFLDSGADDVISVETASAEMIARIGALLRIKDLHDQLAASRAALQEALSRERKLLAKLRRDNAELRDLATTDPLTHVQNVRSFHDLLEHEFRGAKRYGHSLSVLMLDLDHFKVVNDTHGHPSGDYVLKELAVILRQSVRESDVVARTGGEEFAVILPRADREQARQFAERIRQEVYGRRFQVYGHDIHVTTSLGLAAFPDDAEITGPQMLFYCADQALLEAKESGRDRVVPFVDLSAGMRRRIRTQFLATSAGDPDAAPREQPAEPA